MQLLEDVVTLALVVAIQLGMPVSLLFVFGYVRYRNDKRRPVGQVAGQGLRASIREGGPMASGAALSRPCWEVKGCSTEKAEACPAPNRPGLSCWQARKLERGWLHTECLDCVRFVALPIQKTADSQRRR